MTDCCLEAVRNLCGRCYDLVIRCGHQGQESRPIVSKEDKEEDVVIRKTVITNQLRHSGIEIAESGKKTLNEEEKIITHFLKLREEEFTDKVTYSVFCGTWNVNGVNPPDLLKKWFDKVEIEDKKRKTPPDIIVIGLQEVGEKLSFGSEAANKWKQALMTSLPTHGNYKMIKMVHMLRIVMFVYVEDSYEEILSTVDISKVPTGLLGIMGNKGGVGIRMNIHDTSLCFINSHLAAHQNGCKRRNKDYRDVDRKMKFKKTSTQCKIRDHDKIFWIGDLNYRIDDKNIEEVKRKIGEKEYTDILQNDQLRQQMDLSAAFQGYKEGEITFKPTYKYDKGTNDWDSSKKKRSPAWCDRILFKGKEIEVDHYNSHPDIFFSDHMPVSSLFHVKVKKIDYNKYDKIYEKVESHISTMDMPPKVVFQDIEVGPLKLIFLLQMVKWISFMDHQRCLLEMFKGGKSFRN